MPSSGSLDFREDVCLAVAIDDSNNVHNYIYISLLDAYAHQLVLVS
ncbi:MAG: hypothetical protein AB8A40_06240 [Prochlorococcus sp.]|jgi:hypothetical protein|nr:hypothetical protein [Prochlorococcaceae cyanobacterium ETNP14_MAG_4]